MPERDHRLASRTPLEIEEGRYL